jgi:hypothetical protein
MQNAHHDECRCARDRHTSRPLHARVKGSEQHEEQKKETQSVGSVRAERHDGQIARSIEPKLMAHHVFHAPTVRSRHRPCAVGAVRQKDGQQPVGCSAERISQNDHCRGNRKNQPKSS